MEETVATVTPGDTSLVVDLSKVKFIYPELKVKLLSENAKMPTRGTPGSSGLDVYTPKDVIIEPHTSVLIDLEIAFDIPYGWDLAVYNKSGIASKKLCDKMAELIDSDYTGHCHVQLFNHSNSVVTFKAGDKVAQLVMRPVWMGDVVLVNDIDKETDRKDGGFGSTGDR